MEVTDGGCFPSLPPSFSLAVVADRRSHQQQQVLETTTAAGHKTAITVRCSRLAGKECRCCSPPPCTAVTPLCWKQRLPMPLSWSCYCVEEATLESPHRRTRGRESERGSRWSPSPKLAAATHVVGSCWFLLVAKL
nr:hypothetical protein Itr_chr05CG16320 [Ipomoea trifida]